MMRRLLRWLDCWLVLTERHHTYIGKNRMPQFTSLDLMKEAEREVAMRRNVYPKWTKAGRMKPAEADMRIAAMQAIVEHFRTQVEFEGLVRPEALANDR